MTSLSLSRGSCPRGSDAVEECLINVQARRHTTSQNKLLQINVTTDDIGIDQYWCGLPMH